MKLKDQVSLAFIFLLLFLLTFNTFGDEGTVSYESYVFEDFDENPLNRWIIRGSKFSAEGYPKLAMVKTWPQALWGKKPESTEHYALGIKGSFDRGGYNYIEIIPAQEAPAGTETSKIIHSDAGGKNWVHNPINFKGRSKSFDIWVWGSNHNFYIEVYLQDFNGTIYRLPLGDLNYIGWKNLSIEIPPSIPQAEKYVPSLHPLKFIKLMVWTRPGEIVDGFYIYLDQIKILTDLFESRYDGDELEDPEFLDEIWGTDE